MAEAVIPTSGMVITEDTQLAAGVFHLPNGLRIEADGITVTGQDTTIVSASDSSDGIHIENRRGVTLRNLNISGFYHGVRADNCSGLHLDNVTVRNTQEIAGIDTFLYLWLPIEDTYAGGILLNHCHDSRITNCDLQHQMHGILLYDCATLTVEGNNASFNSGWGIYLANTSDSLIQDNRFDFCNRVYQREDGSVRVEADAAGMVLVKGSSRNRFLRNSCLCGGDGIFLCGYEHPGKLTPCNDNLFEENDCRLSPNNAIESTFSRGNIYRRNDCSRSNYGFWMGYSWENTLEDNTIEFNRWAGIAIEHGYGFTIRNNRVERNGDGLRLFTRGGGGPVMAYYPDHAVCYNFEITQNQFNANEIGIHIYTGDDTPDQRCHDLRLHENHFGGNQIGARCNRVEGVTLSENDFEANIIAALQHAADDQFALSNNRFSNNADNQQVM